MKLPTDLKILKTIYKDYAEAFERFDFEEPEVRHRLIYLPIDIERLAAKLKTSKHLLFGRLYYHLDHVYGYKQDDDAKVHLFAKRVGDCTNCINYPYLAAVVSQREVEHRRNLSSLVLSILALLVSFATFGWHIYS